MNYMSFLLVLAICFIAYGFDIVRNGYKNLIHKTPNMDTLVTIGVMASFIYSIYGTVMILKGKTIYQSSFGYAGMQPDYFCRFQNRMEAGWHGI